MIVEIQEAYRGKTVFLTGHTGFKGSWMCLWLKSLGARVIGYSLEPPTIPSNFVESNIAEVVDEHVIGDIRDHDRVLGTMRDCRPDFVFHLAAQTVVRTGYQQPRETFDVNVTGTASLLDAVIALSHPCSVVCVTSDKCYSNDDRPRSFVESDPMGERDPYGASKGCTELVVKAYAHSFFHPERYNDHHVAIATARAGNVIGGGDWTPHALIPDLAEAAKSGQTISLRNPNATRPWQHVLQTLSGYLLLAVRLNNDPQRYHGGWNFGPEEREVLSVAEFSEFFFRTWGQGTWRDDSGVDQPHEAQTLTLSIAKAREQLGWYPRWDTQTTINMCVAWFKHYLAGKAPVEACLEQIHQFEHDSNSL
ncbi:CDP-glucose 4,6-dehydratase [Neorhodopirellula pilleata]|uniref:CDP-glucose 4,6-dehydratase n=1 Tax=Neorhodopirellula pilleata TaxID=2714738 RepID=A0A5C6AB16_9BACT|nr:CDP-glucose 4,6-dehydratase [Neorhodopirellula pilleata]TWT96488.1 CDP-glucose 4,6-dehydratase [Neorhodopirellula pilleata]